MLMKDVHKAKLLTVALEEWSDLEEGLSQTDQDRGFEMSAGDIDSSGVQPDGYVTVDMETGRLIAAAAKAIIVAELEKLSVDVPVELR